MVEVLIVEDDPMVAQLNKKYLQMLPGFNLASVVSNGEQALHFIHDNHIDLLLLDVFMPKLNGLELLKYIRISYPKIDIIMVTAACNTNDIQTALRLGVIDYIVKPFTFLDYLEEQGEIESHLTYLPIGRPVKRYIYQK